MEMIPTLEERAAIMREVYPPGTRIGIIFKSNNRRLRGATGFVERVNTDGLIEVKLENGGSVTLDPLRDMFCKDMACTHKKGRSPNMER